MQTNVKEDLEMGKFDEMKREERERARISAKAEAIFQRIDMMTDHLNVLCRLSGIGPIPKPPLSKARRRKMMKAERTCRE